MKQVRDYCQCFFNVHDCTFKDLDFVQLFNWHNSKFLFLFLCAFTWFLAIWCDKWIPASWPSNYFIIVAKDFDCFSLFFLTYWKWHRRPSYTYYWISICYFLNFLSLKTSWYPKLVKCVEWPVIKCKNLKTNKRYI